MGLKRSTVFWVSLSISKCLRGLPRARYLSYYWTKPPLELFPWELELSSPQNDIAEAKPSCRRNLQLEMKQFASKWPKSFHPLLLHSRLMPCVKPNTSPGLRRVCHKWEIHVLKRFWSSLASNGSSKNTLTMTCVNRNLRHPFIQVTL